MVERTTGRRWGVRNGTRGLLLGAAVVACISSCGTSGGTSSGHPDGAASDAAAGETSVEASALECPAMMPTGSGPSYCSPSPCLACPAPGACSYGPMCCYCAVADSCGGQRLWGCTKVSRPAGCPATAPVDGVACSAGNITCEYCEPGALRRVACSMGKWSVTNAQDGCSG